MICRRSRSTSNFRFHFDEWLQMLQSGGRIPDTTSRFATSETDNTSKVLAGFIQVCRNYLRSYGKSWKSLDNDFLKHVYESGTAFYVYPGRPLIDLVIPLRITTNTESTYEFVPMLVFATKSKNEQQNTGCLGRFVCLLCLGPILVPDQKIPPWKTYPRSS